MKYCITRVIHCLIMLLISLATNSQGIKFTKKYQALLNSIVKGQEVYMGISNSFMAGNKKVKPAYFLDYVLREIIKDTAQFELISNRNNLKMIKPIFVSDYEMVFNSGSDKNKIVFSIKKKRLDENTIKGEVRYDTIDNIIIPVRYKGLQTYGLSHSDTGITHISECTLQFGTKRWHINKNEVGNLFFPNFLYRSSAIRPVEVFLSENGKFVYVYVFGLKTYPATGVPYYNAYMAKLVFNLEKGILKKFVVTGNVLEEYKCNYDNFIGF